jgi:hypothetical protein
VKQRQQVGLDLLGIDDAGARQRPFSHVRQQPAQKGDLQVGRDATSPRHPQTQVGFHVAVGHHHAHRDQRAGAPPLVLQIAHKGRQQRLGAIRAAHADHGRTG